MPMLFKFPEVLIAAQGSVSGLHSRSIQDAAVLLNARSLAVEQLRRTLEMDWLLY